MHDHDDDPSPHRAEGALDAEHACDGVLHRRALLAGMLGLGGLLLPWPAHAAPVAGAVSDLKGEAIAETAGSPRRLAPGVDVFVADTVSTGDDARIALKLGRATVVRLGAKARLKIDAHLIDVGGELDLQSGPILFDRRSKGPQRSETVVRTPYGLLAVRGTRFWGGMSNGVFGVFVDSGRVDVTAAGRTVRLSRGLGTDIARPGDPPTPPKVWGKPRIEAALASVMPR